MEEEGREEVKLKGSSEKVNAFKAKSIVGFEDVRRIWISTMGSLRITPSQQPARKWEPWSYNQQDLNLANSLSTLRSTFIHKMSKKVKKSCLQND